MNRIEHREEKWIFPFVEYSPKNKRDNMAVIIQLHGAGERGDGNEDLVLVDKHGFSNVMHEEEYDCIFIMPQCPKGQFWAGRVESVVKFIEQIIEEYNADKTRITLTGLSMGGFGTWFVAMARPDLFAAIAPACGGGMAWNASVLDMPVWAFHGDQDPIVTPMHSAEMVNKLQKLGKNVRYTVFEGVGHSLQTLTFTKELVHWLLEQRRS
ncbi:MAG: phospholipase [Ruminococcaceae bacterium]|nr:phospholipase [Oscillospiraceae bacterium]